MKQAENRTIDNIRCDRGFTLVELIVVLAVIAIVSSAAVLSVIGYIDKARFDKNEQNAQSVFQAAQAAVNHKKTNGEIEEWIEQVLMKAGKADPYYATNSDRDAAGDSLDELYNPADFEGFSPAGNNPGESVHMRYILTYVKGGSDASSKAVEDLLSGYFYDTTVMQATFTVEFDVEKTIGSDKALHYNANAYAVFYDEGRNAWDKTAMKNLECVVPYRDSSYRRGTSLVGYYNGGMPGAVDSVYVPNLDEKMEFAELTLRNGEALELSFSAVNDGMLVTGAGLYNVHYTASIYDSATDEKIADLAISEAALTKGTPTKNAPTDYLVALKFEAGAKADGDTETRKIGGVDKQVLYTIENLKDKNGDPITRYAATIESFALVYLNQGSGDFDYNSLTYGEVSAGADFYRFPLKISYVINQDKIGNKTSYVAYSIALDSMMSREALYLAEKDTAGANTKGLNYSISRLFADTEGFNKTLAPKNIYVSMTVAQDSFTDSKLEECNVTSDLPDSDEAKASRALDDPVYLQADGSYKVSETAAGRDSSEGYAVVNTYYGDLGPGSMGSDETVGYAAVTSFRHLYNVRFMEGFTGNVEYYIRRDLDWYSEDAGKYTSEVKVYGIVSGQKYLSYHSPVGQNAKYASDIELVMWPALPKLSEKQKIIAGENSLSGTSEDKTSVMRNVQMRRKSFLSTDTGLGFICENDGTVQNIRCENFMLTLDNIADGTASDVDSADRTVTFLINSGNVEKWDSINALDNKKFAAVPIGGLIGLNKGRIGADSRESDINKNTVRMSNVKVLVGGWEGTKWKTPRFYLSTGGVVGEYSATAQSGGMVSIEGYYAVSGAAKVGGIIGAAYSGIDAYLVADTTLNTDKAAVDFQNADAFVMGRYIVGGAVGYMKDGYFAQKVFAQDVTNPKYTCDGEGVVNIEETDADKYGVYVNLSSGSYIRQAGSDKDSYGNAGAVGQIENHAAGKALNIKVVNAGLILSDGSDKSRYVSEAVGFLNGGSASSVYINAENIGSIGTKDGKNKYDDKNISDTRCYAAAAGIAYIKNFGNNDTKYVFNVKNSGLLYGGTNAQTQSVGIGMAVGVFDTDASPTFIVKAVNSGTINATNYVDKQIDETFWKKGTGNVADFGVGGAIGFARSLGCSHIYAEHVSGSTFTANGNNVGGAVGCIRNEAKGNSEKDAFTVTSVLQDGVSVIAEGINVGGCIGNIWNQSDYCLLRTKVEGNVSIKGYKNIGGVAGRDQQGVSGEGACASLQGAASAPKLTTPTLTIRASKKNDGGYEGGNTNAGGVIGVAGSRGVYKTSVVGPTQNGTDNLIVDIKAYSNLGGLVGTLYLSELEGNTPQHFNCEESIFTITLSPASAVTANSNGQYAGGAIGLICDNRDSFSNGNAADFNAYISVIVPAGRTDTAALVSGKNYLGGAVGAVFARGLGGNVSAEINSPYAVAGNTSIGGSIGGILAGNMDGSVSAEINSSCAVAGSTNIGGAIGNVSVTGINGDINANVGINSINAVKGTTSVGGAIGQAAVTDMMGNIASNINAQDAIVGTKWVGGAIGNFSIAGTGTEGTVKSVLNASGAVTSNYESGGCVGQMVGQGTADSPATLKSVEAMIGEDGTAGMFSPILGKNNNMGGCIGVLKGYARIDSACTTVNSMGSLITFAPEDANVKSNYGGVVGHMMEGCTIADAQLNGSAQEALLSVMAENTGGIAGIVDKNCTIENMEGSIPVNIYGLQNVGGYIGNLNGGTIGTAETKITVNNIKLVKAEEIGKKNQYGTGGLIGFMHEHASLVCEVELTLAEENIIQGGYNSGGIIGYMESGHIFNRLSTDLAGGQILSCYGGIGGVIGNIYSGTADEFLQTTISYRYSKSDIDESPLGGDTADKSTSKGVGGVVGQIGSENTFLGYKKRESEVKINTMALKFDEDFVLLSGSSSIGGVLGQIETKKGEIAAITVKSIDNGTHKFKMLPKRKDAFDVGGLVGYMLCPVPKKLEADDIEITVKGNHYIGGWIGGLDGAWGTNDERINISVEGVKSVTGEYGVGGVIGCLGAFNDGGKIYGTMSVDLKDAEIKATKGNGAGGAIGLIGKQSDVTDSSVESVIYGNVKATLNNTIITGDNDAGGAIGCILEHGRLDDDCKVTVKVAGDSTVAAKSVGGIVGANEGIFLAEIELDVDDDVEYKLTASGGNVATVMGRNKKVFGQLSSETIEVPEGDGAVKLEGTNTGAILGYNERNALCGLVEKSDGGYKKADSGELTYKSNVKLTGTYIKSPDDYKGFAGKNDGTINRVVMVLNGNRNMLTAMRNTEPKLVEEEALPPEEAVPEEEQLPEDGQDQAQQEEQQNPDGDDEQDADADDAQNQDEDPGKDQGDDDSTDSADNDQGQDDSDEQDSDEHDTDESQDQNSDNDGTPDSDDEENQNSDDASASDDDDQSTSDDDNPASDDDDQSTSDDDNPASDDDDQNTGDDDASASDDENSDTDDEQSSNNDDSSTDEAAAPDQGNDPQASNEDEETDADSDSSDSEESDNPDSDSNG